MRAICAIARQVSEHPSALAHPTVQISRLVFVPSGRPPGTRRQSMHDRISQCKSPYGRVHEMIRHWGDLAPSSPEVSPHSTASPREIHAWCSSQSGGRGRCTAARHSWNLGVDLCTVAFHFWHAPPGWRPKSSGCVSTRIPARAECPHARRIAPGERHSATKSWSHGKGRGTAAGGTARDLAPGRTEPTSYPSFARPVSRFAWALRKDLGPEGRVFTTGVQVRVRHGDPFRSDVELRGESDRPRPL